MSATPHACEQPNLAAVLEIARRSRWLDVTEAPQIIFGDDQLRGVVAQLATRGSAWQWSRSELEDLFGRPPVMHGDSVTYAALVLGVLRWSPTAHVPNADSAAVLESPCLVCPIRLRATADGERWTCEPLASMQPNPALIAAMRALGNQLPGALRIGDAVLGAPVDVADVRVAGELRPGMRLVQLGTDPAALLELALDAPDVPACLDQAPSFSLRRGGAEQIWPCDVDAAQATLVTAALRGDNVFVDALGGTGVTQALAALVMNAALAQKNVLIVAENVREHTDLIQRLGAHGVAHLACSLDAMANTFTEAGGFGTRSDDAGLATALVAQLNHALRGTWRPAGPVAAPDHGHAARANVLEAHWRAMNDTLPTGQTLFEALGQLSEGSPSVMDVAGEPLAVSPQLVQQREHAVQRYAAAAALVLAQGPLPTHPWYGAHPTNWSTTDCADLGRLLATAEQVGNEMSVALAQWEALVPGLEVQGPGALARLGQLAQHVARVGGSGLACLGTDAMLAARSITLDPIAAQAPLRRAATLLAPNGPAEYAELANLAMELRARCAARFLPSIREVDAGALADAVARALDSGAPLRYLRLRGPRQLLAQHAVAALPDDDHELLELVELAHASARASELLRNASAQGRKWFGAVVDGDCVDIRSLRTALADACALRHVFDQCGIAHGNRERVWRALVAHLANHIEPHERVLLTDAAARLADLAPRWEQALTDVARVGGLELAADATLPALTAQFATWRGAVDALPAWMSYVGARSAAHAAGLDSLVFAVESLALAPADAPAAWAAATLDATIAARFANRRELAAFDGAELERELNEFVRADRSALAVAKSRMLAKLAELRPAVTPGARALLVQAQTGRTLDIETTPFDHELAEAMQWFAKGTLVDVAPRDVFARLARLWPTVLPCLIATPCSAARHLPAGTRFDVVVVLQSNELGAVATTALCQFGQAAVLVGNSALAAATAPGPAAGPSLDAWQHFAGHRGFATQVQLRTGYGVGLPLAHVLTDNASDARLFAGRTHGASVTRQPVESSAKGRFADELVAIDACCQLALRADADARIVVVVPSEMHRAAVWGKVTLPQDRVLVIGESVPAAELVLVWAAPLGEGLIVDARARARLLAAVRHKVVLIGTVGLQVNRDVRASAWPQLLHDIECADTTACHHSAPRAGVLATQIAAALADRGWVTRTAVGALAEGQPRIDIAVADPQQPELFVVAIELDGDNCDWFDARARARIWPEQLALRGWRHVRVWSLDWLRHPEREIARLHGAVVAALAANRRPERARATPNWQRLEQTYSYVATTTPKSRSATPAPRAVSAGASAPSFALASSDQLPILTLPAAAPAAVASASAVMAATPDPIGASSKEATEPTAAPDMLPAPPTPKTRRGRGGARSRALGTVAPATVVTDAASAAVAIASAPARVDAATQQLGGATSGPVALQTALAIGSAPLQIPHEITLKAQAVKIAVAPYHVAYVPAGRRVPNDLFNPKHAAEVGRMIDQVLAAEAPIHLHLLARRVAAYFGIAKPSPEMAARIVEVARDRLVACWEPNIVWRQDQAARDLPTVRVAAANPQTKREIGHVPLMEIAAATRVVAERAPGVPVGDLLRETAKLLGFTRITSDVKERLARGLEVATFAKAVAITDGRASAPAA